MTGKANAAEADIGDVLLKAARGEPAAAQESTTGEKTGEKTGLTKYRDNPLEAFRNGALFDFRVRVAIALLEHGGVFETTLETQKALGGGYLKYDQAAQLPKLAAGMALDAASELVRLAEERGMVEQFGDPEHMSKGLKD